ncbi:MAG: carnitine dehydratase [Ilumatobacter coccineus]|uniref:Carnitine dehydratase n=1 Tax=Ilumatobacter coccineus TaxID=467094 RepID=A0A2G6KCH7_9ACTN|nr:MAG: carnitine dehydratase [Ilumatobacter coccineus]
MSGPLAGTRIIEIAGMGPGPFAAMMLADMGAEVIRIDRADQVVSPLPDSPHLDLLRRGRRSVALDLKHPRGVDAALQLIDRADALIEGFRPGVMERLGLGPEVCRARHPRLIYGRMTGWGQDGPYAPVAGHDINYIALAGALAHIGRAGDAPTPPLNLVGDFGGGGMMLAFGVVCGLLEAQRSGQGQVIDAAMIDGSAVMMTMFWALSQMGLHDPSRRGVSLLDTGAHFYDVYECSDGEYVSVGAIEPQFYDQLLAKTGLSDDPEFAGQLEPSRWPRLKERLAEVFATKTRDEWCEIMEYSEVCFAPVLKMDEAVEHPHHQARHTFVAPGGVTQPAPAPRFSRTPGSISLPPAHDGQHTREVLTEWGIDDLDGLLASGAARQA